MFASWSRSWEFAKLSYSTVWEFKQLMVFPVVSTAAAILVFLSFLLPMEQMGLIEAWLASGPEASAGEGDAGFYVVCFLFYFCNYFVIVFFNTALVASVLDIIEGGPGRVRDGLVFATRRIHSIFGWALVSAVVGMILKALERNQKVGDFVAGLLGAAWTGLSYFVIPVIVTDGVGPVEAFKRSMRTLKSTWGTALTGNFSLGALGFLAIIPVALIGFLLFASTTPAVALAVTIPLGLLAIAFTSTADAVFKAYLYAWATGKTLPARAEAYDLSEAFSQR